MIQSVDKMFPLSYKIFPVNRSFLNYSGEIDKMILMLQLYTGDFSLAIFSEKINSH